MILDGTLKDGEIKIYKDLGNGWVEDLESINIKNNVISAYGSVDIDELNKVMDRLNKIPNYDELIKDNNKKDKEIQRLNNIIDELEKWLELEDNCTVSYPPMIFIGSVQIKLKELKEGK